ncbi:nucleotidyltransferase family protein [Sphingomonas montanisoli]|uniref:Nucleotidyltransferase family protein n=1 Tax=Sphingomonas montanisoli TaxID=2606412 RepID=A0A5D9C7U0_9SPHN|nr:nucleotidyltransferase family protein [Sphingomonas montanisoli]TZG27769.1 nucleotidyltransferase family protein [Sphingomonas montanisoli]
MTVGAIILAAGLSRRMGADKLAADLNGKPLLAHAIDAVEAAGLPMILAIPPRDGEGGHPKDGGEGSPPAREGMEVPDHALGMGHSIAAAIRAVPADWSAALICLGDMPFVAPATLRALAAAAREDRVIAPVHEGQRGNPLAWGRAFFAQLAGLTGDTGGRALLAGVGERLILLPVDDPGVSIDVDTPGALAAARARV